MSGFLVLRAKRAKGLFPNVQRALDYGYQAYAPRNRVSWLVGGTRAIHFAKCEIRHEAPTFL